MMFVKTVRCLRWNYQNTIRRLSVVYAAYGAPGDVLSLHTSGIGEEKRGPLGPTEVFLRMLAAPVNPADINMIQGTYPIKPTLPAVGGNEGVFEVLEVGSKCSKFKQGDRVLPLSAGWGTWRSEAWCSEDDLQLVPADIPVIAAATITVNPCTAYRMLEDYQQLQEGDVVVQNSGNSGVGQTVIQIAAARNLRTINIVRDRPDLQSLIDELKSIGATEVVTEEFAQSYRMKSLIEKMGKPKLALNGVGGKSSLTLLRLLVDAGSMVTYGGMSRQPVTVPTGLLIFNNVKVYGFWMTKWASASSPTARHEMLNALYEWIRSGSLRTVPHNTWKLQEFQSAVMQSMEPFHSKKQVFVNEI